MKAPIIISSSGKMINRSDRFNTDPLISGIKIVFEYLKFLESCAKTE